MRLLARLATLLALCLLTPAHAAPQPVVADVEVTRDGNSWIADYHFSRAAPAWAFLHSALAREDRKPWRPRSWTIETKGLRLERHGWYDVLVSERGNVPERVRIRFTPSTLDLEADYDPALVFSDGAVALFTDQFDVTPLPSAAAAAKLPIELRNIDIAGLTRATFRDRAGKVLHAGVRKDKVVTTEGRSYVLFGKGEVVSTADIAAVLDPALPKWLADDLRTSTPRLLALHRQLLGPRSGPKPMLMASWAGPTPGRTSLGGSVLPGLVLMAFEGAGVAERSQQARDYMHWFVAHETAHFWLGQTVDYDAANHAWMTEGGADLIAVRAIPSIDPAYDPRKRLNEAIAKCAGYARRPVNSANERSEHDAYYACGAVFGLVAEAAQNKRRPGGGIGGFWRSLIEANRKDGVVSQADWLAMLTQVSRDPTLARDIRRLAERGSDEPRRDIASLFRRAGVAHDVAGSGELRLR
ncbi:MAG TPA: hypothetical protein VF662_13190 [Allosphingosinicella sp.]